MERRLARLVIAACASAAALGCQNLIGADFDSARAAPAAATTDGGSCQLADPPARPSDLPKAADSVDFTVVINQLDFGDDTPDAGVTGLVGYDQDHLCTTESGPPSCKQYSWLPQRPTVDGPGGRDDGVGVLFKEQRSVLPGGSLIGSAEENAGIASGATAPPGVLRIRGFSGLGSDDKVVVEFFQAAAFDDVPQPGASGDGGGARPHFDGSDQWPLVRATLAPSDGGDLVETTQRDDAAFVIEGTLVAHFDELRLPMHNVYLDVSKVVLTAHLTFDKKAGWTLRDGTMASRLETKSLLAFAPLATVSAVNVALCKNDALNYAFVKKILCESADLPAIDGDPNSACAYTSLGMGFQTSPASLGRVVDVAQPVDPCPPDADPAMDTCEVENQ
ncbi:MAG TPA: hypothetical protein VHC69_11965 [Polyangiaceae bacterium]|nr:hypothetical protein [Polyangiaceae bacterium]